ncbi:MAG: DUF433 domain-containing protein [Candidatus Hydrogenedentota bacterium]
MNWEDYIELNPEVMVGKPVVKGTRLTVEHVVGLLAAGWPIEDILQGFPSLTRESIQACLAYALDLLESEVSLAPAHAHAHALK